MEEQEAMNLIKQVEADRDNYICTNAYTSNCDGKITVHFEYAYIPKIEEIILAKSNGKSNIPKMKIQQPEEEGIMVGELNFRANLKGVLGELATRRCKEIIKGGEL